jgi:hypothetical protein
LRARRPQVRKPPLGLSLTEQRLARPPDRTAIPCRKSEIELSLPHEQFCVSRMAFTPRFPFQRCSHPGESRAKKFPAKIPRNPLISLVSDERIQGNPRESNRPNPGFSQRKGREPREPKSIGPISRAPTVG